MIIVCLNFEIQSIKDMMTIEIYRQRELTDEKEAELFLNLIGCFDRNFLMHF